MNIAAINNYTANGLMENAGNVHAFYVNRILGSLKKLLMDNNADAARTGFLS